MRTRRRTRRRGVSSTQPEQVLPILGNAPGFVNEHGGFVSEHDCVVNDISTAVMKQVIKGGFVLLCAETSFVTSDLGWWPKGRTTRRVLENWT